MAKATLGLDKPFTIKLDDTVDNTTKIIVVLMLDISWSMKGAALQELMDAVQTFLEALADDDYARYCVELLILTFSDDVKVIHDYSFVDNIYFEQNLEVENMTNMGKVVNFCFDSIHSKREEYKRDGVITKVPLAVLITDGEPSDDITDAVQRSTDLIAKEKLKFLGIGVGDNANMKELKRFNPNGKVVKSPTHDDLKELLVWVSDSLSKASQAAPGEEVKNNAELDSKFKLY